MNLGSVKAALPPPVLLPYDFLSISIHWSSPAEWLAVQWVVWLGLFHVGLLIRYFLWVWLLFSSPYLPYLSLKTWLSYFRLWRAFIPPFSNLSTFTIKTGCRGPPWCSHRNCVFPCKWKTWLFFFPLVIYVSTTKHKLPREESWVPSESNIWQSSSPRVALNKY